MQHLILRVLLQKVDVELP